MQPARTLHQPLPCICHAEGTVYFGIVYMAWSCLSRHATCSNVTQPAIRLAKQPPKLVGSLFFAQCSFCPRFDSAQSLLLLCRALDLAAAVVQFSSPAAGEQHASPCPGAGQALQAITALTEGTLTVKCVRGCIAAWSLMAAGAPALQVVLAQHCLLVSVRHLWQPHRGLTM